MTERQSKKNQGPVCRTNVGFALTCRLSRGLRLHLGCLVMKQMGPKGRFSLLKGNASVMGGFKRDIFLDRLIREHEWPVCPA